MNASSEEAALLAAVLDQPDDDTPRLVYADWLQENGDEPSARFVRQQVWNEVPVRVVPLSWLARAEGVIACQPHQANRTSGRDRAEVWSNYAKLTYRRGFACELWYGWRINDAILMSLSLGLDLHPIKTVHLPHIRIEIVPPGEGYNWQAYYYLPNETDYCSMNGWETRAEMAAGVVSDVRHLEAEFA